MKICLLVLCCLVITPSCLAQNTAFVAEMEAVLAREDTASTYLSVLHAAHALEELAVRYDEWLAAYWAAFTYTQAGLFAGMDERLGPYLGLAQVYYDRAWAANPERAKREEADFYMLQALIHSFQVGVVTDEAEQRRYRDLTNEYMDKAHAVDPDNARYWTMKGIGLVRQDETRQQGREVLAKAKEKHALPLESSIHPSWSRQWIDFWLARYTDDTSD